MSKKLRSINTRIWDDSWFTDLTPDEKLIWIYLLTNPLTNLIGIYEIPVKRVAFDTGISLERVRKAFESFQKAKKALFIENYVLLVNFYSNQSMNTNMVKGSKSHFDELPETIKNEVLNNPLKGFETLRNGLGMVRKYEYKSKDEDEVKVEVESEFEFEQESESETKENDNLILIFDEFRKAYPGVKRGLDTELKTLKKHKDWKTVIPQLESLLKSQHYAREENRKKGNFVPEWKHLQTYINQRGWEEQITIQNNNTNGTKSSNNKQGGTGAGFDLKKAFAYIDEMYERRESRSNGDSDSGEDFFDF